MPAPAEVIPAPQPTAAMLAPNKGFGISTENFDDGVAAYSEEQQETLRFWFHLAKDRDWSLSDLQRHTGISTTTLSRIFRGVYGADIEPTLAKLAARRATFDDAVENPDFILTSLARLMFAAFDKTRALRTVTIMWGPKGIGKSVIEREYTRRNGNGHTVLVRCPGHGCTFYQFVSIMARAMHISSQGKSVLLMRDKIGSYLSRGHRLLILDELHEIFLTCHSRVVVQICEFLRELYDLHDFGLVLTGTEVMHQKFFRGDYADVLSQLVDRGVIQIPLPQKPTQADVTAFLSHYGLAMPPQDHPAHRILMDIIASAGLRKLTLHLRDGSFHAGRLGEPYTWEHFAAAHKALASLQKRRA